MQMELLRWTNLDATVSTKSFISSSFLIKKEAALFLYSQAKPRWGVVLILAFLRRENIQLRGILSTCWNRLRNVECSIWQCKFYNRHEWKRILLLTDSYDIDYKLDDFFE